jgi:Tol biopolymer transport system component
MPTPISWVNRLAGISLLLALAGCGDDLGPQRVASDAGSVTDATQLTRPTGPDAFDRAEAGRLSPDGQWVVFRGAPHDPSASLFADAKWGLYLARVRWSGGRPSPTAHILGLDRPFRITPVRSNCGNACFSPDGRSLLLIASLPVVPGTPPFLAYCRLCRADDWASSVSLAGESRAVDLTRHPITPATTDRLPSPVNLSVIDCDWSADGKTIAMTATDGGPARLFSVRPDGSHLLRLAPFDRPCEPTFSPDGRRLAYRTGYVSPGISGEGALHVTVVDVLRDPAGDVVDVWIEQQLTHETNLSPDGPRWMPDGQQIIYSSPAEDRDQNDDHDSQLCLMRSTDGTARTRLTGTPGRAWQPDVSSDGRHLLWTGARSRDDGPQLFAGNLNLPPAE